MGVKAKHWKKEERKKEKKKESSRHEEKKEERKEERKEKTEKQMWREEERKKKKKLVIRQDTKQWVPFVAKNYGKCHLTLFSIFRNSQIVFLILVSHHSKTKELGDGNIAK